MDYSLLKKMKEKAVGLKATKKIKEDDLFKAQRNLTCYQQEHDHCLQARALVQKVAEETQKKIEFHISNLVSMALASIYPDPYEFKVRFVQRRNRTECDLIFIKNGNETDDILNSGGGGVADIASFALRIAVWSIKKTRATFLLDEPMKFIHDSNYQEKTSEMIQKLSESLNIQIIMISDLPFIIKCADRIIRVKNIKGESKVSVM